MKFVRVALPVLLLLSAAACGPKRLIPAPEAGWMPIGGTLGSVTSLDTARIEEEGEARLVWVRIDSIAPDTAGKPVLVPGTRRESRHRIRCGALTVEDLDASAGSAPAAASAGSRSFDAHPYGATTFPTVCRALGVVANIRRGEREE